MHRFGFRRKSEPGMFNLMSHYKPFNDSTESMVVGQSHDDRRDNPGIVLPPLNEANSVDCIDELDDSLRGKTAIVTGGRSAVGLEAVRTLASSGCRVYICSSKLPESDDAAINTLLSSENLDSNLLVFRKLDLADLLSIKTFAEEFLTNESRLDYLILNENFISSVSYAKEKTSAGFEKHIGVNHFGHAYLVSLLLPRISDQSNESRIIILASQAYRVGLIVPKDLHYITRPYQSYHAYATSKLANLLFAKKLSQVVTSKNAKCTVLAVDIGNIDISVDTKKTATRKRRGSTSSMTSNQSAYFETNTQNGQGEGSQYSRSSFGFIPRVLRSSSISSSSGYRSACEGANIIVWACLAAHLNDPYYHGNYIHNYERATIPESVYNYIQLDELWEVTHSQLNTALLGYNVYKKLEKKSSITNVLAEQNSSFGDDIIRSLNDDRINFEEANTV